MYVYINDIPVARGIFSGGNWVSYINLQMKINKGDVIKVDYTPSSQNVYFVPHK